MHTDERQAHHHCDGFSAANSNARIFIYIEWYPVDSLLQVLPTQQGIERIQTLNRLALSLSFEDAEKSTHYADQAMMQWPNE
jgi:hypothetical protein